MDTEKQHEAQDHHQQSHDVLHCRAGFASFAYHFKGLNCNALMRRTALIARGFHTFSRRCGLDSRIHRPRERAISLIAYSKKEWIAGSSPATTYERSAETLNSRHGVPDCLP